MPEKNIDPTVTRQVALAISRLDSLSILPCVGARFFPRLLQPQPSLSALADIIESDPALAARTLSLIHQQGIDFADENFLIHQALDKLSADTIRSAFLPVKVFGAFDADSFSVPAKKQLALHCLAVACCAEDIANTTSFQIDSHLAYLAGLLHDIGKLALCQAMPKSLASIAEEAKSQKASIRTIEQKHLGTDHTILGKRLAQKWHLPVQITLAVWLHHSDTAAISQDMPEAKVAQIVQLADSISRQCGIGQSGSYDVPDLMERQQNAEALSISGEQLEQIRQRLGETVAQKAKALGLDIPRPEATCFDAIHSAAVQLADENSKLSLENRRLQTGPGQLNFITEFLRSINSIGSPIEIAENFAVRWQKFYQTGMVCLYLAPSGGSQMLEAVVVENLAQSRIVRLNVPANCAVLPKAVANKFAILNAHDHIDWLFEQLDVDFDPGQTKIIPLISDGEAVGAIVFELRYPGDTALFEEQFQSSASIAGSVLEMARVSAERQNFAEQFGQLLSRPRAEQQKAVPDGSLEALAEMAAGAAHELNNPLSVISGQAQLLAGSETEPGKKQILKKIQENSREISAIIEELMDFARPQPPRLAQINIKQILDEAIQLAAQKTHREHINVQTEIADDVETVFIDSAQIASAVANVISNSVESYTGSLGPIKVTAVGGESEDYVRLQIADLGCGMDSETLHKATQPFFSARPAGRKRGMGLSYAARLIELNGGSIELESRPGKGTSVTISLPIRGTS